MKLNDILNSDYDVAMSIAEYEKPDSEYFEALNINQTDDDDFSDIKFVFSQARLHGISPDELANIVCGDCMYMIDPRKYMQLCSMLSTVQRLIGGDRIKCRIEIDHITKTAEIIAEAMNMNIKGWKNVSELSDIILSSHSFTVSQMINGGVRLEIFFEDVVVEANQEG